MVDNKVFVEFHSNVCLVKDKKNHQVILQGKLEDGLYKLHILETKSCIKSHPSIHKIG